MEVELIYSNFGILVHIGLRTICNAYVKSYYGKCVSVLSLLHF